MTQIMLGLLAIGPLSVWAVALTVSERRKTQPALAAYLCVTALTWAVLMVGLPAGWFASAEQYTYFYVASEVVTWSLLAATFLELASLRLHTYPRLRAAAEGAMRWFVAGCVVAIVGFVFAPESLIQSTREFHLAERSLIQCSLALGWVAFYFIGKYFNIQPTGRHASEGWLLAGLYFGCSLFQPSHSFPVWVAVTLLSALCYGYGAILHFRRESSHSEPQKLTRYRDSVSAEIAIRAARARLEALDTRFDSLGKG